MEKNTLFCPRGVERKFAAIRTNLIKFLNKHKVIQVCSTIILTAFLREVRVADEHYPKAFSRLYIEAYRVPVFAIL